MLLEQKIATTFPKAKKLRKASLLKYLAFNTKIC